MSSLLDNEKFQEMVGRETLLAAAFITEGLGDFSNGAYFRGQGKLEAVQEAVMPAAPILAMMFAFALHNEIFYEGVFHYEVSSVFGVNYAQKYCLTGNHPSGELQQRWMIDLVCEFFKRTASKSEIKKILKSVGFEAPKEFLEG